MSHCDQWMNTGSACIWFWMSPARRSTRSRATMAQFADVRIVYQHWNLIRTRLHLHRVLESIKANPGPVLSSMMDRKLKAELEAACREVAGQLVSVLDAVIALLQDMLHEPARGRPGSRYVLVDEEHYNASTPCISCWRMTTARQSQSCTRQTSCWRAFSRVSKMPSCFHLVDRGRHQGGECATGAGTAPAAGADAALPAGDRPDLRSAHPGRDPAHPGAAYGARRRHGKITEAANPYVDLRKVCGKSSWLRRLCHRNRWTTVDVILRSIEETAAAVIEIRDQWSDRPTRGRDRHEPANATGRAL